MGFGHKLANSTWRWLRACWVIIPALGLVPGTVLAQTSLSGIPLSSEQMQQFMQSRSASGIGGAQASQLPTETVLRPAHSFRPKLPPSRLEKILSRRAGVKLRQFGYDQLGVGQTVTVPQVGAIANSYVLGPGDEIVVDLRGQVNAQYSVPVTRSGQVVLPKLAPILAAGRTLGAFKEDLDAAVKRAFVATQAYVTLGQLRQISVLVVGDVANPGTRIVTGLSTPVDAILLSGGIKKTGSLRNVELIRDGHVTHIDLYDLLTPHGAPKSIALADGDRILVPPLGPTVAVTGWVRRPGIYELAPGQRAISVRGLMSLAGGLEVRGAYHLSVLRVTASGESRMTQANLASRIHDSDILYVKPAADQSVNRATLAGGEALSGAFPITHETTLSQVINAPGALGDTPYTLIGLISRRDPKTYMRKLIAFSPVSVLNGHSDMVLHSDDIVKVFSMNEFEMVRKVIDQYAKYQQAVSAAARNPSAAVNGSFNFSTSGQTLALGANGGGSGGNGEAAAAALQAARVSQGGASASEHAISGLSGGSAVSTVGGAPTLNSTTGQQGYGQQGYGQQAYPTGSAGEQNYGANSEGRYPYGNANAERNFGVKTIKRPKNFAQVAEQLDVTPLVLADFLTDHLIKIEGAVQGPGRYLVGPGTSLADVVAAAGGTRNWADRSGVELTTTTVDQATGKAITKRVTLPLTSSLFASYIVRPHDEFRFRDVYTIADAGKVTLQGQVRYPGTYQITTGEHLSDLLIRGGGLTNVAYPYGTIFLRRSVAELEASEDKRAAKEIEDGLIVGMTRQGSSQVSPQSFAALQGFVNQIRNAKPLGRISVIADPSQLLAHPAEDILLEPGDVIYIPQRPSTVAVLGRVLQPGSFPFRPGLSTADYIRMAGGYAQFADDSETYVVLPDGTARRYRESWLNFDQPDIPPGSAVVVPRDLTPLDLHQLIVDTTSIVGQLAVSAASLAVLSKQ